MTQASRDYGVDVIGTPPGGGPKTLVQAKRYDPTRSVSSPEVQQYSALRQQYADVSGVTIVTTGRFSDPARKVADALDVKCIDGRALVRLVREYDALEILEWYAAGKPEVWP